MPPPTAAVSRRTDNQPGPCPQLGLLPGEECEAILFCIPRRNRRQLFHSLKQREGAKPQTVTVRGIEGSAQRVRSFLPPPSSRTWPDADATLAALHEAHGTVGTGTEYVRTLVHAMELWGIEDAFVRRILEQIRR
jgi:cation transport regulator ChaC